ncbi:MAG: hypothetical protein J6N80_08270 [Bacteroidales bacterium]|nr:hypothetical protein [Bacteroidales bacterium]
MRTNHIAMALLASAALMLPSCLRENDFEKNDISFASDEVAFRIGSVQTRSAFENQSETLEIGSFTTDKGETFILEDVVTSMDDYSTVPETRGTPAFTENVKDLYGTFFTVALKQDGKSAFQKNNVTTGVEYTNEKDNIWHYRYGEDIWGDDTNDKAKLPTYFFMRMPGQNDGVTLDSDQPYNVSTGAIKFSYTSPETAAAQKDILFTSYKRTEKTNAEEITFYHALTGVKFANYYDNKLKEGANATVKTIIKSVTISGVKNTGNCTVTPSAGESATSAKSAAASHWDSVTGSAEYTITAGAAPNDTTNYKGGQYKLDELLNKDAAARNINDKDGSMTFFLIPQDLTKTATDSVTLTVVFDVELDGVKTFTDKTLTVNLSDKLNEGHRVWHAGELHTFTLKPTAVGVDIDDDLEEYEKSNVVVENIGNVWQYVRVNIIANWWGNLWEADNEDGTPKYAADSTVLMGYAAATGETQTLPWNDKDYGGENNPYVELDGVTERPILYTVNGVNYSKYGTFVNLPALSTTSNPAVNSHGWVRFDKYYYYTKPIGPGSSISNTLFDSYTVNPSPEFWIADKWGNRHQAGNVHLIMDLMVQAIEVPINGSDTTGYIQAWTAMAGDLNDQ